MPATALVLVLIAAFAHAAWNIIAHGTTRSGPAFLWWGALLSSAIWVVAIPFTGGFGDATLGAILLGIGVSGALHVAYMLVLQRGYARGDLSTVYASARGSGPILTVLIAMALFGERPSPLALCGVALVIAGVITLGLIGRKREGGRSTGDARGGGAAPSPQRWFAPGRAWRIDPAIGYGLATGVAIALYTIWDAHAVNGLGIPPVAFMVGCTAAEVPFFTLLLLRGGGFAALKPTFRVEWKRLFAFGALSPLSYILVLSAMTIAPVSLVAPMREFSVVLVGLYGVFRFKESRPVLRLAAAGVVVAGVLLLGV